MNHKIDYNNKIIKHVNNLLRVYVYKTEKPSVCLSVRHADNSIMSAWINAGLPRCDSYVLWHQQGYSKSF